MNNSTKRFIKKQHDLGKSIVMTCGCFSIFHPGHIEYLKIAKSYGDVLVVGINSDKYLQEVKRSPFFFTEIERKNILSELKCVDYVFIFEEKDFSTSLRLYNPDIFVKGIDYINSLNSAEKKACDDGNIRIIIAGDKKRYNSSEIAYFLKQNTHD